ncbi:HesB/IscA family protein [Sulfuriflexus sp.]|uniref:HesB/IscA family protein n=1 Tax=Sulfuriflexus sp. TaxID=2015443 RepID=UPI0028CE4236|nr:iron-sulfur cluster biosynthesis family protein [Sulfuriflexus sp.]MDT8403987.1 iron-sulfur cluster biosynthesis family protein [Sulfuriflexus sp.]
MITITDAAIEQIKKSAADSDMVGMFLRIAATKDKEGNIEYGMGFDNNKADSDAVVSIGPLDILIGESSRDLLTGATLDFVDIEGEEDKHFIFINPNDPNQTPPQAG